MLKATWYMATGSRYLWRVLPVRFIIRPRAYRLGRYDIQFMWAAGYWPRVPAALFHSRGSVN